MPLRTRPSASRCSLALPGGKSPWAAGPGGPPPQGPGCPLLADRQARPAPGTRPHQPPRERKVVPAECRSGGSRGTRFANRTHKNRSPGADSRRANGLPSSRAPDRIHDVSSLKRLSSLALTPSCLEQRGGRWAERLFSSPGVRPRFIRFRRALGGDFVPAGRLGDSRPAQFHGDAPLPKVEFGCAAGGGAFAPGC